METPRNCTEAMSMAMELIRRELQRNRNDMPRIATEWTCKVRQSYGKEL